MKTVYVRFANSSGSSGEYAYLVEDDLKVKAGDYAVAHTGSRGGYKLVEVTGVSSNIDSKANKTLVTILDMEDYEARNQKVAQVKADWAALEDLLAREYERNKYRILAQSVPEAAELLKRLNINV